MDVVCGSCRAEYEFDDALISERGTTVRCTNCGSQFKIFPPAGVRAVELWRVYREHELARPVLEFDAIEALQRAISTAEVRRSDWLARGDDEPRPLAEIVELLPLLSQRNSQGPASLNVETDGLKAARGGVRLGSSGTVIGIAMVSEMDDLRSAPPPPALPVFDAEENADAAVYELRPEARSDRPGRWPEEEEAPESSVDPDALVPVDASLDPALVDPPELLNEVADKSAAKPRIRSALSQTGAANSDLTNASLITPRTSRLARAFIGAPASAGDSEAPPSSNKSNYPAPSCCDAVESTEPSSDRATPIPPSGDQRTSPLPPPHTAPSPEFFNPNMAVDQGESDGQRLGTKVATALFVAICGGVLIWSRLTDEPVPPPQAKVARAEVSVSTSQSASVGTPKLSEPQIVEKITNLELRWWHKLLSGDPRLVISDQELSALIEEQGVQPSWRTVNLLRINGRLIEARRMVMQLPAEEEPYASIMLAFAEGTPSLAAELMEGLQSTVAGDQSPYLRRAAFIYGLGRAGNLALARTEYDKLRASGTQSTLYRELGAWLMVAESQATAAEAPAFDEATQAGDIAAPGASATTEQAKAAPAPVQAAEENGFQKAAEKKPAQQAPKEIDPASTQVSEAVKTKVEQADALWRGGDREQAVIIYRQVVAEIGTKHFLGQRSAARIAQAAREQTNAP